MKTEREVIRELRAKLADAEAKLWKVRQLHCWTNEDGRRFVFADDLLAAVDPDLAGVL